MGRYAASDAAALATQALEAGERAADLEVSARALVLRGRALTPWAPMPPRWMT